MNRLHLNLALVVVVSALGAALYFTQKKEEKGPPLTALTDATLERIRIEHPEAKPIALQKVGDEWRLTEPVSAAADPLEVASITNLASIEAQRKLASSEVELKQLGLEPSAYAVMLNDIRLEFGDSEPIEYRRYVRVGDEIALIADPSATALDADYSELVAKTLLPKNAEIVEISVPGLRVFRSEDQQSWLLDPQRPDASADQKQAFVSAWKSARAMWNALAEPDSGGDAITVKLKDGIVELRLIAREPQLVIENPALGVRYTLSKALGDEMLQLPAPAKPAATSSAEAEAGVAADAPPAP